MKKSILCVAALIVAAIVSVTVVSCKKDKDEVVTKATNSEAQALLNRIEAFQTLRDAVNSGEKVGGSMTVEEMRETLCLVSNYEYSEHDTYCLNTTLDTLRIPMPVVDINGNVSESDVVAVYNAFETAFQDKMGDIIDGMDVPSLFSIVLPIEEAKEIQDINIVFTRGQETECTPLSPIINGPFDGLCFYWGFNLGSCNPDTIFFNTDAAKEMSRYFKFDYSAYNGTFYFWNVEYVDYVGTNVLLPSHSNWNYWEPGCVTPCDQWLFYYLGVLPNGAPEPCLCEDELNCEYVNIKNDFSLSNGNKYYSPTYGSPFFECIVNDEIVGKDPIVGRFHIVHVTYANYHFTPDQH